MAKEVMRYFVYLIDAFTGHILHPDGSGRLQCVGDTGFHEIFESREEAMRRKDELLRAPRITEVLVSSEDKSESLVFQNRERIYRMTEERKTAFKSAANLKPPEGTLVECPPSNPSQPPGAPHP